MGIVYTPSGTDYQGDDKQDNNIIQEVEPGLITQLPHGWEFKEFDPTHPGRTSRAYQGTLRGIASGLGVSYNSLASDLESVNYSSMRAGSIEERDAWKISRLHHSDLCQPIFAEWLKLSILVQPYPCKCQIRQYSAAYCSPRLGLGRPMKTKRRTFSPSTTASIAHHDRHGAWLRLEDIATSSRQKKRCSRKRRRPRETEPAVRRCLGIGRRR